MPSNWAGLQYPLGPVGRPQVDPVLMQNWLIDQANQREGSIGPSEAQALMAQAQQQAGSIGQAPPPLTREQEVLQALTRTVQEGEGFGMTGIPALGYIAGDALVKAGHPEAAGWAMTGSMAADAALSAGAPMGPGQAASRLVQMGRGMRERMPTIDPDALNRALVETHTPYRPPVDAIDPARLGTGYQPGEALAPGPYLPAGQHAMDPAQDRRQPRVPRVGRFVDRMPDAEGRMRRTRTQEAYLAQVAADSPNFETFKQSAQADRLALEAAAAKAGKQLFDFGGPGGESKRNNILQGPSDVVRLGVVGDFVNNPALRAQFGNEVLRTPVYVVSNKDAVVQGDVAFYGGPRSVISQAPKETRASIKAPWWTGSVVLQVQDDGNGNPRLSPNIDRVYDRSVRSVQETGKPSKQSSFTHEVAHAKRENKGRDFVKYEDSPWDRNPSEGSAVRAQNGLLGFTDLTAGYSESRLMEFYDRAKAAQQNGRLVTKTVRAPKGAGPRSDVRVRTAAAREPDPGFVSPAASLVGITPGGEVPVRIEDAPGVTPAVRRGNGQVWVGGSWSQAMLSANRMSGQNRAHGGPNRFEFNEPSLGTGVVYRGRFFNGGTAQRLGLAGMDRVIQRGEAGPKVNIKNPESLGEQPAPLPPRGIRPTSEPSFAPPESFEPGKPSEVEPMASVPSVVPGSLARYDIHPSPYVKPEMRGVEQEIVQRVAADPHSYVEGYLRLPEVRKNGGRYVNTDTVRELFPEYNANRTANSVLVHEASSAVTKMVLEKLLSEPVAPGKQPTLVFTAGMPGSGKTTAVNAHLKDQAGQADIVYDGTFSNPASADKVIRAALESGRRVHIIFVDTPLKTAFTRAVERSVRQVHKFGSGRVPPISEIVGMAKRIPSGLAALPERWPQEVADGRVRLDIIRADRKDPNQTTLIRGTQESLSYIKKEHLSRKEAKDHAAELRAALKRLASSPDFPPGIAEAFDQ